MSHTDNNGAGSAIHIHIAQANTACATAYERHIGLSVPRWRVLHYLFETGSATQKEICQRVELDGWAVTRAVKPLEQAGLIERTLDPADNRLTRASITEKGRQWYSQAQGQRAAFLDQALQGFSENELVQFEELLIRFTKNIQNHLLPQTGPSSGK